MKTALARLRAKTDRELVVMIQTDVDRALALAGQGRYSEAVHLAEQVRALLTVSNLPAAERARLLRLLEAPATACV